MPEDLAREREVRFVYQRRRRGESWQMFDTSHQVRCSDATTLSWPLFGR